MKTVCKKLLSLMLVAVLLVSAVPMMASADGQPIHVPVTVYINGEQNNKGKELTVNPDETIVLNEALAMGMLKDKDGRSLDKWVNGNGEDVTNGSISYKWLSTEATGYSLSMYLNETTGSGSTGGNQGGSTGGNQGGSTGGNQGGSTGGNQGGSGTPTPTVYTVTFNYGGNAVQRTYTYGETFSFPVVEDTNQTYFVNWKNDTTGETYGTGTSLVCSGNATYSAVYANKTKYSFYSGSNGETCTVIYAKPGENVTCPNAEGVSGMTFKGWYTATTGGASIGNGFTATDTNASYYAQYYTSTNFPYSVILHIHSWGNVKDSIKSVDISKWGCLDDGVINMAEIESVVKTYYTGKNSDGIKFDNGFYLSNSGTLTNYVQGTNYIVRLENVNELRTQGYVHLNVWIDNYKAKSSSSSNADSSNPKTGDTIFMAVTVMGLSAASLAAVYYISKKRAVR